MGTHEPYWRTNTSFSPPAQRWDYHLQSEEIQYGSTDSIQLFGSTSSNSKESRSWMRGSHHPTHQYSVSEGGALFFSSPSDTSLIRPWTPQQIQEINIDEYETPKREQISGPLPFTPAMEGPSGVQDGAGSTSSRSDSELDPIGRLHLSTPRNFSNRRSFMSKPIHPLSFPIRPHTREILASPATPQSDNRRLSSRSSSIDLTDLSDPYEPEFLNRSSNLGETLKCGLCDRFLSQRSPWSSRRIVKSGDMPVTGVLSCKHVFHADCLEHATPKSHKSDPPCPLCTKVKAEGEHFTELRVIPKLRNNFPRLRSFSEEGSSKTWGCVSAGDCVHGALHTPPRSSLLLFNRNRIKKLPLLKGSSSNELSGKLKKTSSNPVHLFSEKYSDHGGPSMKR